MYRRCGARHVTGLGGVGINLAVQDAVAAARLLAAPLRDHRVTDKDLAAVQRRRMLAHGVTQTLQRFCTRWLERAMDGRVPAPNKLLPVLAHFP